MPAPTLRMRKTWLIRSSHVAKAGGSALSDAKACAVTVSLGVACPLFCQVLLESLARLDIRGRRGERP